LPKNPGKSPENLGKIPKNLGKIPENPSKMAPNLVCLNNMVPSACRKVALKKIFMIFVGENFKTKVAQKLFGEVWGNSHKKSFDSKKFACSSTYVCVHLFHNGQVHIGMQ